MSEEITMKQYVEHYLTGMPKTPDNAFKKLGTWIVLFLPLFACLVIVANCSITLGGFLGLIFLFVVGTALAAAAAYHGFWDGYNGQPTRCGRY